MANQHTGDDVKGTLNEHFVNGVIESRRDDVDLYVAMKGPNEDCRHHAELAADAVEGAEFTGLRGDSGAEFAVDDVFDPSDYKLIGFHNRECAEDVAEKHGEGVVIEKDNGSPAAVATKGDAEATTYLYRSPTTREGRRIKKAL